MALGVRSAVLTSQHDSLLPCMSPGSAHKILPAECSLFHEHTLIPCPLHPQPGHSPLSRPFLHQASFFGFSFRELHVLVFSPRQGFGLEREKDV